METDKITPGIFRSGWVLIFVWYLLLLYMFPYRPPIWMSRGADFPITAIYILISFALFLLIAGGLFVFALRAVRFLAEQEEGRQGIASEGTDLFRAVEKYFLTHLRSLFLLSILMFALKMAVDSIRRGDEFLMFILAAVPIYVVIDMVSKRMVSNIKRFDSPQWSASAWVILGTFIYSFIALIQNVGLLIGNIGRYWSEGYEWEDVLAGSLPTIGMILVVALIVLYSGGGVWKRRRDIAADVTRLFGWLSSPLRRKISQETK